MKRIRKFSKEAKEDRRIMYVPTGKAYKMCKVISPQQIESAPAGMTRADPQKGGN